MKQEEKTGAGQAAVFVAGVAMFLIGLDSLWQSLHAGDYVFRYVKAIHTGTFALILMVSCLLLGWYLMASSWRRLR
jgi:hypothetical protein